MNSLKKPNRKPGGSHRAKLTHRLSKERKRRKPKIKQGRKRKKGVTRKDKIGEKTKIVTLLQLEQMPLKSQRAKKRSDAIATAIKKTSLKSPAITVIRKAIISGIVPSQKTSYSLNNLHIGDC